MSTPIRIEDIQAKLDKGDISRQEAMELFIKASSRATFAESAGSGKHQNNLEAGLMSKHFSGDD